MHAIVRGFISMHSTVSKFEKLKKSACLRLFVFVQTISGCHGHILICMHATISKFEE